jgi:ornithine decarboxylase
LDLILQIAEVVNLSLDKYFPDDVRIIAEPGRFYVASAFTIATNVIAKRVVARDQQGESTYQFKYRSILFIASNFINSVRFDNSFCLLQYSYYEC